MMGAIVWEVFVESFGAEIFLARSDDESHP